MRDDVRQLWTAALRSGDYKQAEGNLRVGTDGEYRYCCLGVLCDLAVKAGVDVSCKVQDLDYAENVAYYDDTATSLPLSVMQWAGLPDSDPRVNGSDLSWWNDITHTPFADIADMIDEHLKESADA